MTNDPSHDPRSGDPQSGDPEDLLDLEAASAVLGVPQEQVRTMSDQGLITAEDGDGGPRFRRAELIAARDLGG